MPGSTIRGKQEIKEWIEKHDVHTILDVGCGSGTYVKLIGRKDYYWVGLDIWGPYIDQFKLRELYHEIIIADIRWVNPDLFNMFDTVIFGDILEHMDKTDANRMIRSISNCNLNIIVSLPLSDSGKYKGKTHYNNGFEKHISFWTFEEFNKVIRWTESKTAGQIGLFFRQKS